MAIYANSEQLYRCLKLLFDQIYRQDSQAGQSLHRSNLTIRLRITAPEAELVINGRKDPPEISYGKSGVLLPDLNVDMSADTLHFILTAELPLGKALASRQMRVRGPVWKSFVLEEIFHSGQAIYPQVFRQLGLDRLADGGGLA